ncbi:MAG: hypothetical protein OCU12_06190 [Methanophagales archaeon]|nr:hypothetical protein [Methanophagales archaeon]
MDFRKLMEFRAELEAAICYVPPDWASDNAWDYAERRAGAARQRLTELAPVFAVADYVIMLEAHVKEMEEKIAQMERQCAIYTTGEDGVTTARFYTTGGMPKVGEKVTITDFGTHRSYLGTVTKLFPDTHEYEVEIERQNDEETTGKRTLG